MGIRATCTSGAREIFGAGGETDAHSRDTFSLLKRAAPYHTRGGEDALRVFSRPNEVPATTDAQLRVYTSGYLFRTISSDYSARNVNLKLCEVLPNVDRIWLSPKESFRPKLSDLRLPGACFFFGC